MSAEVVEYALRLAGGSMEIRSNDSELEEIYPTERWITNQKKHHKVYRRTVIIVEDWQEV